MKMSFYLPLFICISLSSLLFSSSPSQEGSDPFITDPVIIGKNTEVKNYYKPKNSTMKFKIDDICFWYNSNIWKIHGTERWNKRNIKEISFESNKHNLFATILVEKVRVPQKEVRSLVWERIEETFDNVKLHLEERRMVNGSLATCYLWSAYYKGDNLDLITDDLYYFYIYVLQGKGTVQVITFCGEDDFNREERVMLDFLNGIDLRCE